jgi:glycosyltransferase involved in cell wall biosynthesis
VDWSKMCAVVIPCFNEGRTVAPLVGKVRRDLPTIIVVDDGSTDQTGILASGAGAQVLKHPRNLGKGAALRTGLTAAAAQGFTWAISMDGDGQHRPEDIETLLQCAGQTGAALVAGNRMHDAQSMPWSRRLVNIWMSRLLSRRAGRFLPDSQCGFRLLFLKAWAALRLETDHFEVESEMLLAFLATGHNVEFVPIGVVGRGHCSRIHPVVDTLRWFRWWRSVSRASAGQPPSLGVGPSFDSVTKQGLRTAV